MEINWCMVRRVSCAMSFHLSFVGVVNERCARAERFILFGTVNSLWMVSGLAASQVLRLKRANRRLPRHSIAFHVRRPAEWQIEIESKTKLKMCVCAIQMAIRCFAVFILILIFFSFRSFFAFFFFVFHLSHAMRWYEFERELLFEWTKRHRRLLLLTSLLSACSGFAVLSTLFMLKIFIKIVHNSFVSSLNVHLLLRRTHYTIVVIVARRHHRRRSCKNVYV